MKVIKKKFVGFCRKYYLFLFGIVFVPSAAYVVYWVERNKVRRLSAAAVMAVIGLISIIYAHSERYEKRVAAARRAVNGFSEKSEETEKNACPKRDKQSQ